MQQPRRRLSAVWFADIVGYSTLSSRDEPAALRLVAVLQTAARSLVEESEGRIVKFIGDAVLAEFGSTESAVRAAVALYERFAQESAAQGIPSQLRIGVHLGEVTATPDGDLYGDGLNAAARLQREAAPGQIVVSEDVWRQLRQRPEFRFQALGAVELRGITTRMAIYDVLFGARAALIPVEGGQQPKAAPARRRPYVLGAGIVVLLAAVGLVYAVFQRGPQPVDRNVAAPGSPAAAPDRNAQTSRPPAQPAVQAGAAGPQAESKEPAPQRREGGPVSSNAGSASAQAPKSGNPQLTGAPSGSAAAGAASTPVGALPPGDVARVNDLLRRFARALGGTPGEMRQVFPGFTPAHAQAFYQVRRGFGPGLQAMLGRVEPREVAGDTVRLRFMLLVRSDRRPASPIGFDATVTRRGADWVFTDLRRAGEGNRRGR